MSCKIVIVHSHISKNEPSIKFQCTCTSVLGIDEVLLKVPTWWRSNKDCQSYFN